MARARRAPGEIDPPAPVGEEPEPTGAGAGDGLTIDSGRPFRADAKQGEEPEAPAPAPEATVPLIEEWSEETVRSNLVAQGALLHTFLAVDSESDEWVYLEHELDAIAPPLTRIFNRYPQLRAVAPYGDLPALTVGLASYTKRSLEQRAADKAAAAIAAEQGEHRPAHFTVGGEPA